MTTELPSIVDVAEKAGVSVATASRVMSSSSYPVSVTARQKVLKAAEELHYAPNSLARGLKAQRSKLIAVIVGDNSDPYFAQVARGVEEIATENGYLTIICNTDRNPTKELSYLQTLQDYRADGFIFAGGSLIEPDYTEKVEGLVQKIQQRGAAIITLSPHSIQAPSLQTDNFGGSYALTTRLIEMGHQRIAVVTGPSNFTVANVRLQGYMAALARAGIVIDPDMLLHGNFTQASGEQAARILAQRPKEKRPTAVFALNDETAIGMILGLRRLSWRIPGDISICGFGDIPTAELISPSLTTVRIGLRELGRAGATRILAQLNKESVAPLEMLPATIIERESTSPLLNTAASQHEEVQ